MSDPEPRPETFWAGGFLYNSRRDSVFLHHRDNKTKNNPNKWAFFGGLNEGSETCKECFARELREEIGLGVAEDRILPVREYVRTDSNTHRAVFYVFYVESEVEKDDLTLGEGAGFDWVSLNELDRYDLTDKTKEDLEFFVSRLKRP
jgi:8-oxo-dGTP pyrophosphatase MutT (NUDIX family)